MKKTTDLCNGLLVVEIDYLQREDLLKKEEENKEKEEEEDEKNKIMLSHELGYHYSCVM